MQHSNPSQRPKQLDVYYGTSLVGTIHDTSPLAFEYAPSWLSSSAGNGNGQAHGLTIAAIEWQPGRNNSSAVQAYFENLLPEGERRQYLALSRQGSSLFSLLFEVAGDTAGGFVIVPGEQKPAPDAYTATTWKALAFALQKPSAAAVDLQAHGARVSLAGAQEKTSIAIFEDGLPRHPKGTSPSTHILKPNIKRLAKVWHSAANETIVMRAAAHCGLPTAEVFYEPHTASCVVRRFDRLISPDRTLARLVQYDICQLAGTVSEVKYEKEGGPSLATCAEMIRRYSTQPAVDLRHFVNWIFFNLYVGNNDSHAKNLSIYQLPGKGVTLTPFYDIMCTRLYPGLAKDFAFAIGGEYRPAAMHATHLSTLAQQLGMRPQFLARQAKEMALQIPAAIDKAVFEIKPVLPRSAKTLADRLQQFVLSTTKNVAARVLDVSA